MSDSSPILDYASPRKRVRLRLPANSVLDCRVERDEVIVREVLKGRDSAIAALLFACFTLFVLIAPAYFADSRHRMPVESIIIICCVATAEVVVMLMVIHQTWRQTLLTIRYNEMLLAFTSPLYRKRYNWTGNDIADVLFMETANSESGYALAELLITRCVGGEIHLFTDHPAAEIRSLLTVIPPMLREGQSVPLEPVAPVALPEGVTPAAGAIETSARLLERQREIRNRRL